MKKQTCEQCEDRCCISTKNYNSNANTSGAVYGLGLIGAAIFFIGQATTFWMGVLGFLKALVWPVFLVYEVFNFLMK